jgi:hypothetical protein
MPASRAGVVPNQELAPPTRRFTNLRAPDKAGPIAVITSNGY